MNVLSKSTWDALRSDCKACSAGLEQDGYLLDGNALQAVHTATTVRVRNGRVSTTDGPFAETKEQLGGYYLLDARDKEEALRLASSLPPGRFGCVEVRPVREPLQ